MSIIQKMLTCLLALSVFCLLGCYSNNNDESNSLNHKLWNLIDTVPGTVGIAFISDADTVTVNNGVHFPMMSVFKLHQSLAVAEALFRKGTAIDTVIHVGAAELDPDTWSPMLKDYGDNDIDISVRELMRYALTVSDNNASNLLFKHIISPSETDSYIRKVANDKTFQIKHSEEEMKKNHSLAYSNHTSPLPAAILIKQVFETQLTNSQAIDSIRNDLTSVTTGQDRLGSILEQHPDLFFAHKTGSGYRNDVGELAAHNDVGYFQLPDGRKYAVAVFIRDFSGSEQEASHIIAQISETVYDYMNQ